MSDNVPKQTTRRGRRIGLRSLAVAAALILSVSVVRILWEEIIGALFGLLPWQRIGAWATDNPAEIAAISVVIALMVTGAIWLWSERTKRESSPVHVLKPEREHYLATSIVNAYKKLDLDALAQAEDDQILQVNLPDVFVAQNVRRDQPLIELPRDLMRRMAEDGMVAADQVPSNVDLKRITETLRQPVQPVLDVLAGASQRLVVILGDPGSGKSTLAQMVALSLAGQANLPISALKDFFPLVIELRRFAQELAQGQTFQGIIAKLLALPGQDAPDKALVHDYLTQARVLVMFDGLDELFDRRLRSTAASAIADFATTYPQARVIVTSRIIGYQKAVLGRVGFAHFTIQDFDRGQIERFVADWYASAGRRSVEAKQRHDRLMKAIDESASIRELAGNPLLLTILSLFGLRQELPRERHKVYAHAAAVLVDRWDVDRDLKDAQVASYIDQDDKIELLQRVARRMQDSRKGLSGNRIAGDDLEHEIDLYLRERFQQSPEKTIPAAKAMLNNFRLRSFVISHFGDEIYGFVHRGFLEYFAAADIVAKLHRHEHNPQELSQRVFGGHWADPSWQEVLLLVTGMVDATVTGQVIDYLLDADPLWFAVAGSPPGHVLLAARCLSEARKLGTLARQGGAVLNALIEILENVHLADNDPALEPVLQKVRDTFTATAALIGTAWPDRDGFLHWYECRGRFLTTWPVYPYALSPAAVAGIIAAALHADNPGLRSILTTDALYAVEGGQRLVALRALVTGWPRDEATRAVLEDRAVNDSNEYVRRVAVESLASAWRDDGATLPLLRERFAHDSDTVRQAVVHELAIGWRDDPATRPLIDQILADNRESALVRRTAVRALAAGWPRDPAVFSLIRQHAQTEPDGFVQQAAVGALATTWRDEPAVHPLIVTLASEGSNSLAREVAVQMLATGWGDLADTAALIRRRAIDDPDGFVRQTALRALAAAWPESQEVRAFVRERAMHDHEGSVRHAALLAATTTWRDDRATFALLRTKVSDDDNGHLRQAAVQALATDWHTEAGVRSLVHERVRNDPDRYVRQAALQALAAHWPADPATLDLLRGRATDNDDERIVRQAAIQVLAAGWRHEPATLALIRSLATADRDHAVREAAVHMLLAGWHAEPGTRNILWDRATRDDHANVRCVAMQALVMGWRDDVEVRALVSQIAKKDTVSVREHALRILAAVWPRDAATHAVLRERAALDDQIAGRLLEALG